ncbi:tyrosine phosphatase family protein [Parvularcula sp. IMCC14364]|uniref:tyrosine phosphatase family protein n=1 Tax=Parvularcula sp. IMCC14364 TaxID=3067902 RepID=UPI0027414332|nr:hypothetical protein [Parvularcula sp. IMCC14364]
MIVVCPYDEIDAAVEKYQPASAISILDQGEEAPTMRGVEAGQHLRLSLSMAVAEMMMPPCPEQETARIKTLLDFAQTIDWSRAVLVHCRLGLSRSPAAAFILQCALAPEKDEQMIAEELRASSENVEPSLMMVAKADELLGRDGRMINAIDHIGMGNECLAGHTFSVPFLPETLDIAGANTTQV